MGWLFARPSITALEVAWRWIFGAPLLVVGWMQAQKILADLPPESTGLNTLDLTNPWVTAVKVAVIWDMYRPHIVQVLSWMLPAAALAWIVLSGLGRNLVLKRMEPSLAFRPLTMIAMQAAWLLALGITCWGWFSSIGWAAAREIGTGAEPNLIAYAFWAIFLSIGFFILWALVSWVVTIAPMLMLLENRSAFSALRASCQLGKPFTGKLVEINLVMGIVKIALLVVAMVLSSVLIPFSEEVGASTLHTEWIIVSMFYFIASDYFQVVRLKGFIEFWKAFRGGISV